MPMTMAMMTTTTMQPRPLGPERTILGGAPARHARKKNSIETFGNIVVCNNGIDTRNATNSHRKILHEKVIIYIYVLKPERPPFCRRVPRRPRRSAFDGDKAHGKRCGMLTQEARRRKL